LHESSGFVESQAVALARWIDAFGSVIHPVAFGFEDGVSPVAATIGSFGRVTVTASTGGGGEAEQAPEPMASKMDVRREAWRDMGRA
jgi:hypothetical protein